MTAQKLARKPGNDKLLLWATSWWFIVTFLRPENIISPLQALYPGLISDIAIVVLLVSRLGEIDFADPLARCYLIFLGVVVSGVVFALNTYWAFETFLTMLTYGIVFFGAVPVLLRHEYNRTILLRVFFLCVVFTAFWCLLHRGSGQGGWLLDQNDVALFLNVGICISYFYGRAATSTLERRLIFSVAGICAVAVVATFSRGGFIALAAAVMAIALYSRRAIKVAAIAGLLFGLTVPILATLHPPAGRGKQGTYLQNILSIADNNDSTRRERLYTWTAGWIMFKENPILGIGAGNYPFTLGHYESDPELIRLNTFGRSFAGRAAHSLYFSLLSELGSVGTAVFAVMWLLVLRRTWRISASSADNATRYIAAGVGAALLSYSIGSIFLSSLYYPPFWLFCGLVTAKPPITVFSKPPIARPRSARTGVLHRANQQNPQKGERLLMT